MKKVAIAAVLCALLMVTLAPGIVLAKAEKADLRAYPAYAGPVAGFVILNNDNEEDEVVVVVSLKEGAPDTVYSHNYLQFFSPELVWTGAQLIGSFTTNGRGKGNLDARVSLTPGTYYLNVVLSSTGEWGEEAFWSDKVTITIKQKRNEDGGYVLTDAKDITNIATHEPGHTLVLEDLYQDQYAQMTMYRYSDYGEVKKISLEPGDIAGSQKLYGK